MKQQPNKPQQPFNPNHKPQQPQQPNRERQPGHKQPNHNPEKKW